MSNKLQADPLGNCVKFEHKMIHTDPDLGSFSAKQWCMSCYTVITVEDL